MSIILVLQRLMQENQEFKANLDYRMRSCSNKQTSKINLHFGLPQMSQSWTLRSTNIHLYPTLGSPCCCLSHIIVCIFFWFWGPSHDIDFCRPKCRTTFFSLTIYIPLGWGLLHIHSSVFFSKVSTTQGQLQARTLRGSSVVPSLFQDPAGFLVFGLLGSEHS